MGVLDSLSCAATAIRSEIVDFDLDYPLEIDLDAGVKDSLHYYRYSDALAWRARRTDADGIPRAWYRTTGARYWPAYSAWYGLVNLGHYLRRRDERFLEAFLRQVDWLEQNAVTRDDGAVVWPMTFDYQVGETRLRAPWVSAHAQGLAISALVRGWRVTKRSALLDLLAGSARIFELDDARQGIRLQSRGSVLYTEVPGGPPPGILDGFLTSLLGLYDLFVETGDPSVGRLFDDGLAGLASVLPEWDYRHKWSWYGCHNYLSPPAYHCLNRLLLGVVAGLGDAPQLAVRAEEWNPAHLAPTERAEIYLLFLVTKNACRIRHRTWMQRPREPTRRHASDALWRDANEAPA